MQDAHDIFGDVSGLLEQYQASKAARGAEQGAEEEPDAEEDEAEPEFEDDTAAQQWQLDRVRLSLSPDPFLLSAGVFGHACISQLSHCGARIRVPRLIMAALQMASLPSFM